MDQKYEGRKLEPQLVLSRRPFGCGKNSLVRGKKRGVRNRKQKYAPEWTKETKPKLAA